MADKPDGHETRDGYGNTEPTPVFASFQEMQKFMRNQFPPSPEPKEIEHVILDADDTIWRISPWGLASLGMPEGRTEGNTLPVKLNTAEIVNLPEYWERVAPTGVVKLDPKLRYTLDKLKEKGIPVSIASSNDKDMIEKYLEAFGLRDEFADIEATFYKSKDQMVKNIAKRQNVDSEKILFVDDGPLNCMDVSFNTNATSLLLGYNIENLEDLLEFIK